MAFGAGEAFITVLPDASGFLTSLTRKILPALKTTEAQAAGIGRTLLTAATSTPVLAAGLALAGGAAAKLAIEFESSMDRIIGLVGVGRAEVEQFSTQILALSKTLPVAPNELANALFFVTSAGQRGAQAMETLRVSAMAAAAGLGDTKTIADAVTSAMNSYATSGLTAAQATDVLIAAVREGKLEPAALAGALGQVLPVASQVGVSFAQVAAAIASATKSGLDATRAATGVRFLLTSFIKPSQEAVQNLNAVGLTIGEVQRQLADQGLLATLKNLADQFDLTTARGRQMFAQVVGGARGMSVASILVGQNWEAVAGVFDNVTHAAGSLDTAFRTASETVAFKFGRAVSSLQSSGIKIGATLLPVLAKLADVLAFAAGHADLLFAALAAYVGLRFLPALLGAIQGSLIAITEVGAVSGLAALTGGIGALAAAGLGLAPLAAGLGAVYLAVKILTGADPTFVPKLAPALAELSQELPGAARQLSEVAALNGVVGDSFVRMGDSVRAAIADFQFSQAVGGVEDLHRSALSLSELAPAFELMGTDVKHFRAEAEQAFAKSGRDVGAWGDFVKKTLASAREAFAQWREQTSASLNFASSTFSSVASDFQGSSAKIASALGRALRSEQQFGKDLLSIAKDGTAGSRLLVQQLLALGPAGVTAARAIAGGSDAARESIETNLRKMQEFADSTAAKLQGPVVGVLNDIKALLQAIAKAWNITVKADTSPAKTALSALAAQINAIVTKDYTASIRLAVHGDFSGIPGNATGFHGQVSRPTLFLAGEAGSERVDITPGGGGRGGGSGQIRGQLQMTDWARGRAQLIGELDWADAMSAN